MIKSSFSKFSKKGVFVTKIRNFCKGCDSVHLCVVLGSGSLHMGFNMMNPVDFSEKGSFFSNFWATRHGELHHSPRRVIIRNPEILVNSPWRVNSLGRRVAAELEIFCLKTML